MIKVEDMMTRHPHTLLRTHTLNDAKHLMEALDIRHVPIVDANKSCWVSSANAICWRLRNPACSAVPKAILSPSKLRCLR